MPSWPGLSMRVQLNQMSVHHHRRHGPGSSALSGPSLASSWNRLGAKRELQAGGPIRAATKEKVWKVVRCLGFAVVRCDGILVARALEDNVDWLLY
jgi:hypothetical protein